jgi:hypothetical protein
MKIFLLLVMCVCFVGLLAWINVICDRNEMHRRDDLDEENEHPC